MLRSIFPVFAGGLFVLLLSVSCGGFDSDRSSQYSPMQLLSALIDADASAHAAQLRETGLRIPQGVYTWPTQDIPVCFAKGDLPTGPVVREQMRRYIEDTIGRVSGLRFSGWSDCDGSGYGIALQVMENHPTAAGRGELGYRAGEYTDVWFYRTIGTGADKHTVLDVNCASDWQDCEFLIGQYLVLHEFMHALGFGHNFNDPANEADKFCGWDGAEPGLNLTPGQAQDKASIMNSGCLDANDLGALSGWDVVGLQRVYGRKHAGAMVGFSNRCLTMRLPGKESVPQSEAPTDLAPCLGGAVQTWRWNSNSTLSADFDEWNYLEAGVDGRFTVADAHTATPSGGEEQRWSVDYVGLIGVGDLAVESNFGDISLRNRFENHDHALMYAASAAQPLSKEDAPALWQARRLAFIASPNVVQFYSLFFGVCLAAPLYNGAYTGQVQLASDQCDAQDPAQQFTLGSGQTLRTAEGYCLTAELQDDELERGRIFVRECLSLNAQKREHQIWNLRGRFTNIALPRSPRRCLDASHETGPASARMSTCQLPAQQELATGMIVTKTLETQLWDYHWRPGLWPFAAIAVEAGGR